MLDWGVGEGHRGTAERTAFFKVSLDVVFSL